MPVVTRSRAKMGSQSDSSTLHNGGGGDLPWTQEATLDMCHQRQNPLMNDVILSRLFEHLNSNDLQTSRLVCKKWHFGSILSARSEFKVNLGESASSLADFVQVLRSNKLGNPFGKFHLTAFDTTKGVGREFLQICGETSKEFALFRMTKGSTFMVQDVTNLLKAAPRLESFHLPFYLKSRNGKAVRLFPDESPNLPFLKEIAIGSSNDHVQRKKFCPTLFEELFMAAKNISTLILTDYCRYGIRNDSLEVLETLEKLGRESSIRHLSITYAEMEHFELLKKMVKKQNGLKLKTLEYGTPYGGQLFATGMIELFKDTLIFLALGLGYSWRDLGKFPEMLMLKELKLYVSNQTIMTFHNCNNNFPALEILNFRCASGGQQFYSFFSGIEEPCPKMTKLILQGGLMRTKVFRRVVTTFPNLKELQIEVKYVPILKSIFTHLTQLEVLRISGLVTTTGRLDSLFTRILARDIEQFGDTKEYLESLAKMTLEARRDAILKPNEHRKPSSIANLTNLRDLTLDIEGDVNGRRVTSNVLSDRTGIWGLYFLEKLKSLVIRHCLFSKTCTEMLVTDMKLQAWSFTEANGTEIIPSRK